MLPSRQQGTLFLPGVNSREWSPFSLLDYFPPPLAYSVPYRVPRPLVGCYWSNRPHFPPQVSRCTIAPLCSPFGPESPPFTTGGTFEWTPPLAQWKKVSNCSPLGQVLLTTTTVVSTPSMRIFPWPPIDRQTSLPTGSGSQRPDFSHY